MKIVCISDTHNQHSSLHVPDGDLLIHAGDVSGRGGEKEVLDFLKWFSSQPHPYKIFIAGNHDFYFERENEELIRSILPNNVIYLNDSGVSINGINIWGSPITPWFYDWAFNRNRGEEIKEHWNLIPSNTDILITHGPPAGILDYTTSGKYAGCSDLLSTIQKIKPRMHVFGHIHEAHGKIKMEETVFVNASVLDERYRLVNEAILVEF